MSNLALYTFGVLRGSYDSHELREFAEAAPTIFGSLLAADGFIDHAGNARIGLERRPEVGDDFGPWGILATPGFFEKRHAEAGCSAIQTLSLWRDCQSAKAFTYGQWHRDALMRRAEWFVPAKWPGYVLWWVEDHLVPTWSDGIDRLEALAVDGPTRRAFNFSHTFDQGGRRLSK